MHTPIFREHESMKGLVIFIHGFMGSPCQFDDLTNIVFAHQYSVLTVLLPGHGGDGKEFARHGLNDWEKHLQNKIDQYRNRYKRIYLIGHSMGGLLALNASLFNDNPVCGIFLMSCPMKIRYFGPKAISARLRLLAYAKEHPIKAEYIRSNSVSNPPVYVYPMWLHPILSLKKLIRKTRKNLGKVDVPVVIIHSKQDETVSFKSAQILYDGLVNASKKRITLNHSWHACYTREDKERMIHLLLDFIRE